jgi:Transglycosylase SLT domain
VDCWPQFRRALAGLVVAVLMLAGAALLPPEAVSAAGAVRTAFGGPRPAGDLIASIPANYLTWYVQAARTCPGLTWEVLAGIGTMESNNGRSHARGVHQGKNRKGAEGPMQFEPGTFAEYAVRIDRSGRLTPYNPPDAIFTAARMLCADGAASGTLPKLKGAIYAYNHAHWYVTDVLAIAARYTASARRYPPAVCQPRASRPGRPRPGRPRAHGVRASPHRPAPPRFRRPRPARPAHRARPTSQACG